MNKQQSEARRAEFKALWDSETPVDEIARKMGYKNRQTVWATATNMGLKRRFFRDQKLRDAKGRRIREESRANA